MEKVNLNLREELFKNDCKTINLRYEYSGYVGKEKYTIITELSEEELMAKYSDIIEQYIPFVLLSLSQGKVIDEYYKQIDKDKKRQIRHGSLFSIDDGNFEAHHPECAVCDDLIDFIYFEELKERLHKYLNQLEPITYRRIIKFYFDEKSITQISIEEGVSRTAVSKSIAKGIEKLRKLHE